MQSVVYFSLGINFEKIFLYLFVMMVGLSNAEGVNHNLSAIRVLGGDWELNFTYGKNIIKPTIYIYTIKISDQGSFIGYGNYYLDNSKFAIPIACNFDPDYYSKIESDYVCVGNSGKIIDFFDFFGFKFRDNQIVTGFYGSGNTLNEAANNALQKQNKITGTRLAKISPIYRGDNISTYNIISWSLREKNKIYCIDIADENGSLYDGMHPLQCSEYMTFFSPIEYVSNIMKSSLPSGFVFKWKIWSKGDDSENYGGNGFEGLVVVP